MKKFDNAKFDHIETLLAHAGRNMDASAGFINVPPFRGSTVALPDLESLETGNAPHLYGRTSNPTSDALEELITMLEGGAKTKLMPSGLSAVTTAITMSVGAGDEILIADCVYSPTRIFADGILTRMGVKVTYFDPRIGSDIAKLITDQTRAIYLESPGSLTFEIQDLPAISEARAGRDIAILIDNTWATPLFYQPLSLGADIVIHSGTKYFCGHADVGLGSVTTTEQYADNIKKHAVQLGVCASPDDIFLVLRGMRTLAARMRDNNKKSVELAQWLQSQDAVTDVLHPALSSHPDHDIFSRDFSGSGSVFSFELAPASRLAVSKMLDDMNLFAIGASYGGFESLILAPQPAKDRSATQYEREGNLVRIHVGSENADDLKTDLEEGIARYNRARN